MRTVAASVATEILNGLRRWTEKGKEVRNEETFLSFPTAFSIALGNSSFKRI